MIDALLKWGASWAFAEPQTQDLDPLLLLWWMRGRVCVDKLPDRRVVVQIDFTGAVKARYWLLLSKEDVSICLTDPGFAVDILVTADIATFYQVWLGRVGFGDALGRKQIQLDGLPTLAQAFPTWFFYKGTRNIGL